MRRVIYSVAASLDGYIAGPNGEYDWLVSDSEVESYLAKQFARFDTFLMGSGTYGIVLEQGEQGFATFEDKQVFVCSDTLAPAEHPRVEIVRSGELTGKLASIRDEPGKDIWLFGGGKLFRSLAQQGLVDVVEVGLMPILIGEGIPLLPGPQLHVKLQLRTHRAFEESGIMMLEYDVVRA